MNIFLFKNKFTDKYAFILISVIFAVLYFLTYSKWGIILFDCFHDYYVAEVLMTGKQLYTEIAYLYPPLVPYLFKLLFTIFTPNLNIFYIFGGITAYLFTIILYTIARQVLNIKYSVLLILLFLSTCAFDPGNKNYIFGYVAPAILANLFALATLLLVILHYKRNNPLYIYLCSILTVLGFLTKVEFAFAQIGLLITYSFILYYLNNNRFKDSIYSILIAIVATFSIYVLLIQSFGYSSVRELILPSNYLNAAKFFHSKTVLGGISLDSAFYGLISLAILVFIGSIVIMGLYYYIKYRDKKPNTMLICLTTSILLICGLLSFTDLKVFISENNLKLFAGSNFIVLVSLIYFIKNLKRDSIYVIMTIISFFSLLISFRSPLFLNIEFFGSYYLPAVFIVLFYFLFKLLPDTLLKNADIKRYSKASTILIICIVAFFTIKDAGLYARKTSLISKKGIGSIWVDNKFGKEVKTLLNIINKDTKENDKIFVIPEEVFYYIFTDKFAPGKYYYINPGALGNSSNKVIKELNSTKPKYIILSNLPRYEFGTKKKIDEYYQNYINWIEKRYEIIKTCNTSYLVDKELYYKINLYKLKKF